MIATSESGYQAVGTLHFVNGNHFLFSKTRSKDSARPLSL